VNCCAFDSIPSDLGALLVAHHIKTTYNLNTDNIRQVVRAVKGGASGGTLASLLGAFELPSQILNKARHPFALNPPNDPGGYVKDQTFLRYDYDEGKWTIPYVMGAINTRIVRRSTALLGNPYGRFKYSETLAVPNLFVGFIMWFGLLSFLMLASFRLTRYFLKKLLPQPGQGPDEKSRREGYFKLAFIGESVPRENEKPIKVRAEVIGKGDPGYQETSKMVAESALCLLLDQDKWGKKKEGERIKGGVVTPASVMGLVLVNRLRDAGISFEVLSDKSS